MSTPVAQTPEEIPKENDNVDTPSAKQSHAQKCLNLIFNTKNKDDVDTEQVKAAGESYANFFDIETDLKLEDDGRYNLAPSLIFPTVTRDNLSPDQQSTLDQILNYMRCSWSKKFKIKVRTGNSNTKKKRSHTHETTNASPPHQKVKVEKSS